MLRASLLRVAKPAKQQQATSADAMARRYSDETRHRFAHRRRRLRRPQRQNHRERCQEQNCQNATLTRVNTPTASMETRKIAPKT